MFENSVKDGKLGNHFKQCSMDMGYLPAPLLLSLSMDLNGMWIIHCPICIK